MFGLDYVTGPPVASLKDAGVTFVCRYLSEVNDLTKVKLLTPDEAKALAQAGIAIVSNYEWYANRAIEGFASGKQDAEIAAEQHTACGGPSDRPIYFSVDADVDGSQTVEYFKGVASVLGLQRTGAYGSYRVLKHLFDNNLIVWGWQTYAWSDGAWEPRAHIQQYENGVNMAGYDVDYNRSTVGDFGQWTQGGSMQIVPQGWAVSADGKTLTAPNDVPVGLGFCQCILNYPGGWNPDNWPQESEYHADPAQEHRPDLKDGQRICFRDCVMWFTSAQGVILEAYPGLELDACYKKIAALEAQIASAQQPAPAPINPDVVAQIKNALASDQAALKDLGQ